MNKEIRNWMYRNARPLDIERFKCHFEDGCFEDVMTALKAFQNEDGGFGHALESDSWNPNSSPLQTWTATEIIMETGGMDSKHQIIVDTIEYLDKSEDFISNRWFNTIPSNNAYPGAPWWLYEKNQAHNLRYNPSACLAGFILLHANKSSDVYAKALRIAKESIQFVNGSDLLDEMHEVFCFVRLKEYLDLAELTEINGYNTFKEKLNTSVHSLIEFDFTKWAGHYVCKPSQFFMGPTSEYYEMNKAAVLYELNNIVEVRDDEGIWPITWNWEMYASEFAISKRWWQGNLIIKNLLMLKNYKKEIS